MPGTLESFRGIAALSLLQPEVAMTGIWKDYSEYKTDGELAERYYAFIAACFEEGIKFQ